MTTAPLIIGPVATKAVLTSASARSSHILPHADEVPGIRSWATGHTGLAMRLSDFRRRTSRTAHREICCSQPSSSEPLTQMMYLIAAAELQRFVHMPARCRAYATYIRLALVNVLIVRNRQNM